MWRWYLCECYACVFCPDTATTVIYTYCHTVSLHDALPIYAGNREHRHAAGAAVLQLALELAAIEFALAQHLAEFLPRLDAGLVADQGVEQALFRRQLGAGGDLLAALLAGHGQRAFQQVTHDLFDIAADIRSEEHTSELQSLMRISYDVFCLKNKKYNKYNNNNN